MINTSLTEFYLSTREFPSQPSIKHVLVHAEDGLVYSNLFYRQRVFIGPEKTFVIFFLWRNSHESISLQMYKHRSAPVITPNKHTYNGISVHTRMHRTTWGLRKCTQHSFGKIYMEKNIL